jgi:hypothetical protein
MKHPAPLALLIMSNLPATVPDAAEPDGLRDISVDVKPVHVTAMEVLPK